MEYDEFRAWLRLSLTPSIGNASARRLLARLGTPQKVFEANSLEWSQCVRASQIEQLKRLPPDFERRLSSAWRWLEEGKESRALITLGDPRYPPSLMHIADPPLMLYVQGAPELLQRFSEPLVQMHKCLAIVGVRHPTMEGADNARHFARTLAQMGWSIVSGLAIGIDSYAHGGALEARQHSGRGNTIAVLGTGLDIVYPRRHQGLAQRIAQSGGLLLSEFPLGTAPIAHNFPKRNRIISGLAAGTLVVEAAVASGSLVTARLASEQGREVFAVPSSIHSPLSRGCHALIRQGAKLVESAQDILEELGGIGNTTMSTMTTMTTMGFDFDAPASKTPPPEEPQHPLLKAMGSEPIGLDALSARTGLDAATLQAQLLELELEGNLRSLPGGVFQRCAIG